MNQRKLNRKDSARRKCNEAKRRKLTLADRLAKALGVPASTFATRKPVGTQVFDLDRPYMLDVMASGHVFVRGPGQKPEEGSLPVFSTDTREEAQQMIVRNCKLARDNSGLYRLNDWPAEPPTDSVAALGKVSDLFRLQYAREKAGLNVFTGEPPPEKDR